MEASLNQSSGVLFKLAPPTHFVIPTTFRAFFLQSGNSRHSFFSVEPSTGEFFKYYLLKISGAFPAFNPNQSEQESVQFQVVFTPTKHIPANSTASCNLIIEVTTFWCQRFTI